MLFTRVVIPVGYLVLERFGLVPTETPAVALAGAPFPDIAIRGKQP
jgi:hypothetical protein